MITCKHCNRETDDGAVFCENCGHELAPAPQRADRTSHPAANFGYMPSPSTPDSPTPDAPDDAPPDAQPLPATPLPPNATIMLNMANGQRFALRGKSDYTIGRLGLDHPGPDVDLASFDGYRAGVSREHIMIHVRPDGVFVEDLESTNETVHNRYRLKPKQWYPLHEGDQLRLGGVLLYVTFERP